MPTETSLNLAQQLYIAYYGRPADPAGLQFWASQIDAAGGDLTAVIAAFATSPESVALYGAQQSPEDRVTVVFQNLLGRMPDPEGLAFYTNALNTGVFDSNSVILAILEAAQNEDQTLVDNKVAAATRFTEEVAAGNVQYNTAEAAAVARTFLNQVDATPESLTEAEAAIPAFLNVTNLASTNPGSFAGVIENGVINDPTLIREDLVVDDLETPPAPTEAPPPAGGGGGGGGAPAPVDNTAPSATIAVLTNNMTVKNGQVVTVEVVFSEAVSGFTLDDLSVSANAGTLRNLSAPVSQSNGSVAYTLEFVPGNNIETQGVIISLANTYSDLAANTGLPAVSAPFDIDTAIPAAPVINAVAMDDIVNAAENESLVISGTGEPGATVTLSNTSSTATVAMNGTWSITIADAAATFDEGAETLSATQTDLAGNTSVAGTRNIVVDTIAPAAPTINVAAGDDIVNAAENEDLVISGTGEPGATVTLSNTGDSAIVGADGNWSITIADAADAFGEGAETLSATQTDLAGNTSPAGQRTIFVDTDPADIIVENGDNLQQILDAAEPGSIIEIQAGTFSAISINKNLILRAASDAEVIINGNGVNQGAAVRIADGVQGVSITGITMNAAPGDLAALHLVGNNDNSSFQLNSINGGTSSAVLTGGRQDSVSFNANDIASDGPAPTFYNNGAASLGPAQASTNLSITNNTVAGGANAGLLLGIESTDSTISNNTLTGNSSFAQLEVFGNGVITGNTFAVTQGLIFSDPLSLFNEAEIAELNNLPLGTYIDGGNGIFSTITAAVAAAAAESKVFVLGGMYSAEATTINLAQPITLEVVEGQTATLTGSKLFINSSSTVKGLNIVAGQVTTNGEGVVVPLSVNNGQYAIRVSNDSNPQGTIANIIDVNITKSTNPVLADTAVYGVQARTGMPGPTANIEGGNFTGLDIGVFSQSGSRVLVDGATFTNNIEAITSDQSDQVEVVNSTFNMNEEAVGIRGRLTFNVLFDDNTLGEGQFIKAYVGALEIPLALGINENLTFDFQNGILDFDLIRLGNDGNNILDQFAGNGGTTLRIGGLGRDEYDLTGNPNGRDVVNEIGSSIQVEGEGVYSGAFDFVTGFRGGLTESGDILILNGRFINGPFPQAGISKIVGFVSPQDMMNPDAERTFTESENGTDVLIFTSNGVEDVGVVLVGIFGQVMAIPAPEGPMNT